MNIIIENNFRNRCTVCKGMCGWWQRRWRFPNPIPESVWIKCETCHGTGYIDPNEEIYEEPLF